MFPFKISSAARSGFFIPHHQDYSCGVDRYWDEIKKSHEHLEFVENPDQQWVGLGLIIKTIP